MKKPWLMATISILVILTVGIYVAWQDQSSVFQVDHEPVGVAFLVKPYLQIGNDTAKADQIDLLWETENKDDKWSVEYQIPPFKQWEKALPPAVKTTLLPLIRPRKLYETTLSGLAPGQDFQYRVLKNGQSLFTARGHARKVPGQDCRFVVFGDLACGSQSEKKIAYRTFQASPDLVMLVGDIVYNHGTFIDYLNNYFPVYNSDNASSDTGAPLLRSMPFVAAAGNHDIGTGAGAHSYNLNRFPDGLAYFILWSQPLDGPLGKVGQANTPNLIGSPQNEPPFLKAAGPNYPRMANFSFDYGDSHWTILDGNDYMNWTDPALRQWVENDLASAKDSRWKFVAFHQPPFNSDHNHFNEQRMRLLVDIFQKQKVDVVFAGHVHNYQRTYPLIFSIQKQPDGTLINSSGAVAGQFALDTKYDGQKNQKPNGIIYIITGGGGATLNGSGMSKNHGLWQPFTCKWIADTHSITVCDLKKNSLDVHQISEDGKDLDHFTISKVTSGNSLTK